MVKKSLPVDVAVCAAAVADFKPVKKSSHKLKKDQITFKSIEMEKNKDILEYISKNNKHRPKLVVGFSAETEKLNKNSILKTKKKNCDLMIANLPNNQFTFDVILYPGPIVWVIPSLPSLHALK